MSERDVYQVEMTKTELTDLDVERLLTGQPQEDPALARLGAFLAALHGPTLQPLSGERLWRLAGDAAAAARESRPEAGQEAPERRTSSRWLLTLRHRLAVIAAAIFVLAGMTGVAAAADEAAPGDPLYGLDRALEAVGIGAGGATERISEAQLLAGDGQVAEAINHVAEAIASSNEDAQSDDFSPESANAADALRQAAANVRDDGDGPESQQIRDAVAAMLEEMADMALNPDFDAVEFGQRVSEMARQIGGQAGQQNRPETPGQAGDAGGDTGPPAGSGGPPDGTTGGGPPGGAGRP